MAFNPFRGFRKQQKVIFAILTIICMLTFVLAGNFRGGDALDWIVGLFGGGKKGEYVATLYGDKIYDVELSRQGYDRNLANFFMAAAAEAGNRETQAELRQEVLRHLPSEASRLDRQFHNAAKLAFLQPIWLGIFRGVQLDQDDNAVLKQLYPNSPNFLEAMQSDVTALARSRIDPDRLREDLLNKKMEREAQLLYAIQVRDLLAASQQSFFAPSTRRQDLLDERVFWHDADKLGIKFTEADIRAEVNRLSPVKDILTNKGIQSDLLRKALTQRYKGVDLPLIYKALGSELRASLAQGIVLGAEPGLHGMLRARFRRPTGITAAEYVHFYEKQRTTLTVDLIAVPAEAFLPEVDRRLKEGKLTPPKESQLQAIFDAAKSKEPDPGSSTPGFKEPQRIGLEWIALRGPTETTFRKVARAFPATGDLRGLTDPREQHYLTVARAVLKPKDPALFLRETGLSLPVPALAAPGPLGPLAFGGAWAVLGREVLLNRAYENLVGSVPPPFGVPSLLQADPTLSYCTALNLPMVSASWIGMRVPGGSAVWPLNMLVTSQMAAVAQGRKIQADAIKEDAKKRAQLVAGLTLASLGPALTRATTWASGTEVKDPNRDPDRSSPIPAATPPLLPRNVSREGLRDLVFSEAASDLAKFFQQKDLDDLKKAIEEASKDPETARAKVDAALKRYPWLAASVGRTTKPVDRHTLTTSPRYRSLLASLFTTQLTRAERLKEAQWYFGGTAEERVRRDFLPDKLFTPTKHNDVLVWKTEDVPARTPASLTEIRAEVMRAWRLQEARKLAREKANEIRDQVAGKKPAEALKVLRGLLAENPSWGYLIHLDKVARQLPINAEDPNMPDPQVHAPGTKPATSYEAYKIPEEDIAYPPANFVNQLVELPEHKATVIADRPLNRFYVAYAEARSAPSSVDDVLAQTFPKDVARNIRQNKIWRLMEREKQQEFHDELMKEMRRQAGTLNAKGRFALNPNLKAEANRGSSSEE